MQENQPAAQIAAKHSIFSRMAPYMSWQFESTRESEKRNFMDPCIDSASGDRNLLMVLIAVTDYAPVVLPTIHTITSGKYDDIQMNREIPIPQMKDPVSSPCCASQGVRSRIVCT